MRASYCPSCEENVDILTHVPVNYEFSQSKVFLSICNQNWADDLVALAEASAVDMGNFGLTATPVPQTIEVRVNGLLTTIGWEYESSLNSVVFDPGYIPEGGDSIAISYSEISECP